MARVVTRSRSLPFSAASYSSSSSRAAAATAAASDASAGAGEQPPRRLPLHASGGARSSSLSSWLSPGPSAAPAVRLRQLRLYIGGGGSEDAGVQEEPGAPVAEDASGFEAKIYCDEKNLLDLYVILLRYSSLLCKTIPMHLDCHTFKSREADFFKNASYNSKLIDVLNEHESLKPIVQWQITAHNRAGTAESNNPNGTYAASHRKEQHTPISYLP